MHDRFRLDDKHALITGATRGIGLAIAQGFLEAGARVTLCSRKPEHVAAAVDYLSEFAEQVHGIPAHVGRTADLQALVERAEERFGTPHILVNNAGTNPYFGPIVQSDEQAWDKTMDVNVKGAYTLSRLCAIRMAKAGGGSIVNIASVAGLTALPQQGIYSVSKAALLMLTKVMARELGSSNIRVNAICPGLIKTKLSEALWSQPESEKSMTRMKALGRIGQAEELVGAAIYLASEASSFTTGSILQVDGGFVL